MSQGIWLNQGGELKAEVIFQEGLYETGKFMEETWDLSKTDTLFGITVGFGVGAFEEIRIIPDSREAFETIVGILHTGGYSRQKEPTAYTKLSKDDDWFFGPKDDAFVFIEPIPMVGKFGER